MKKYIIVVFCLLAILIGVIMVVVDINDEWTYVHSGNVQMTVSEYEQFKKDVVEYGDRIMPNNISVMNSPSGDYVVVIMHSLDASVDLGYGDIEAYKSESNHWVGWSQVMLILFSCLILLFAWLDSTEENKQ